MRRLIRAVEFNLGSLGALRAVHIVFTIDEGKSLVGATESYLFGSPHFFFSPYKRFITLCNSKQHHWYVVYINSAYTYTLIGYHSVQVRSILIGSIQKSARFATIFIQNWNRNTHGSSSHRICASTGRHILGSGLLPNAGLCDWITQAQAVWIDRTIDERDIRALYLFNLRDINPQR